MNPSSVTDPAPPAVTAERLTRQVVRDFSRKLLGLALSLGTLLAVYAALWSPLPPHGTSRLVDAFENVGGVLFANLVVTGYFRWRLTDRLGALLGWIDSRRQPSAPERSGLVGLPRQMAGQQFAITASTAVGVAIFNAVSGAVGAQWARALVGIALFGLTLTALSYLLTERALRPVYGMALTRDDVGHAVGIRRRLLLAWALGSAIPLVFIVTIPLRGATGLVLPMSIPVVYMGLSGLVVGLVTVVLAAGSVADPVRQVRVGLRRVEEGDLDVRLPVEDPGEVGQLQASFNAMVTGLRERRRLQDIFGRHVGEQVARRALETGVQLGGELRRASILFVDLVGSTALAETLPAEEVVDRLNSFFAIVVDRVEAEGGWVDKFEGDGALAVFGVPLEQEDHPARALSAARAIRAAVVSAGIDVGIGVASGEVVAGNIGTERRHEFTVIGRPVNQAARLADLAKQVATRVLVSEASVELAGDESKHWMSVEPVVLRGIDRPVPVATTGRGS